MSGITIELQEAYQPRPVRFLELWETNGWRLKLYGIAYRGKSPTAELVQRAKDLARQRLPAGGGDNYGVGFVGVHQGRGANFVFVDWWENENELRHHVYVALHAQPDHFEYTTPSGLIACVWDLGVLAFERQAWVEYVLKRWDAPDIEGYLSYRMNQDI